jgi:hypothetical protein
MNLLIEGDKIISAGFSEYTAGDGQEVVVVPDSQWKGYRKDDVYWDGSKVVVKTAEIVQSENDRAAALEELLLEDKKMPRGLEDLMQTLIDKGVITEDDLHIELKTRWDNKKDLRTKL